MLYELSVVAILKNEAHILREWIEHYLYHGVEHFYLIDNDSEDLPDSKIRGYENFITWLSFHGQGCQQKAYDAIFPHVSSKWALVADLDEFVYSPEGYSIPYILGQYRNYNSVAIPWLMYGSSGHISQPQNVVQNFTWRMGVNKTHHVLTKAIANMDHCKGFGVHKHVFKNKGSIILANGQDVIGEGFADVNESTLNKYQLLLNHYPIQSKEFFQSVKMTRGDSARAIGNPRNEHYFKAYDYHDVEDRRLANINKRNPNAATSL